MEIQQDPKVPVTGQPVDSSGTSSKLIRPIRNSKSLPDKIGNVKVTDRLSSFIEDLARSTPGYQDGSLNYLDFATQVVSFLHSLYGANGSQKQYMILGFEREWDIEDSILSDLVTSYELTNGLKKDPSAGQAGSTVLPVDTNNLPPEKLKEITTNWYKSVHKSAVDSRGGRLNPVPLPRGLSVGDYERMLVELVNTGSFHRSYGKILFEQEKALRSKIRSLKKGSSNTNS